MPLERERAAVAESAQGGAKLIVFPEAFIPVAPWGKIAAGPLSRETGILSEPPGAAWTPQVTTRVRTSSSCA
jgi:predicted amidohydrolase